MDKCIRRRSYSIYTPRRHVIIRAVLYRMTYVGLLLGLITFPYLGSISLGSSHPRFRTVGREWMPSSCTIGHIYALDGQLPRSGCLCFSPPLGVGSSSDWVMGVGGEVLTGNYLESTMSLLILPDRSLRIESGVEKKSHPPRALPSLFPIASACRKTKGTISNLQ